MKLPWYIKSKGITSKGNSLYFNFTIRKSWIFLQKVKYFFILITKCQIKLNI